MSSPQLKSTISSARKDKILSSLQIAIGKHTGIDPAQINVYSTFLEVGIDSLLLIQAAQTIREMFGVDIAFRQLLEDVTTLDKLSVYLDQHLPSEAVVPTISGETPAPDESQAINGQTNLFEQEKASLNGSITDAGITVSAKHSALERIIEQQLDIMNRQLDALQNLSAGVKHSPTHIPDDLESSAKQESQAEIHRKGTDSIAKSETAFDKSDERVFVPYQPISKIKQALNDRQQKYVDAFIVDYTRRTKKSKRTSELERKVHADSRNSMAFRRLWKEIAYPITAQRSDGSKIWDVDENQYVDLTMGFGVNLFGHSPVFITDAIQSQIDQGMHLGPQSNLAGQVAELIAEMTGMERAAFCNSGTEAVMSALRIARAVTGRDKIAIFSGSYHGTFDGVLGRAVSMNGTSQTIPMAPGVTRHLIGDVIIVDYNNPDSLEILRAQAGQLAAVLVEPIQSRRPDVQPGEFLRELRKLTQYAGVALIFDEIITGFRIHPAGAQGLFGIKADLATYGKVLGGGLPLGVVAGAAHFMDAIDGGQWNFGDDSFPQATQTFFAGTFCKHPLTMGAALAVLNRLKTEGSALQERLNVDTTILVNRLNDAFAKRHTQIRAANAGSLFTFNYPRAQNLTELFFYHLIRKGVYVWEGRTCFLSTAHTREDIEYVIRAVDEGLDEMQDGELLEFSTARNSSQDKAIAYGATNAGTFIENSDPGNGFFPLTEAQKQLWFLSQLSDDASRAYNESLVLSLHGQLNVPEFGKAIEQLVDRHEALRITVSARGDYQQVHPDMYIEIPFIDLSTLERHEQETATNSWMTSEVGRLFDLSTGPLVRFRVLKLSESHHLLIFTSHHIVVDGWSAGILIRELGELYQANNRQIAPALPSAAKFSEFAQSLEKFQQGSLKEEHESYWLKMYADATPALELPTDRARPSVQTYRGANVVSVTDKSLLQRLRQLSAKRGCTLFTTLLSVFNVLLHQLTNQTDIVVGVPAAGQLSDDAHEVIGHCVNVLPLRSKVDKDFTFPELISSVQHNILEAYEHQNFSLYDLAGKLGLRHSTSHSPLFSVIFNVDRDGPGPANFGLDVQVTLNRGAFVKVDLGLNIVDRGDQLILDCGYKTDLFDVTTIQRWMQSYVVLLEKITEDPQVKISHLSPLTEWERHQLAEEWNQKDDELIKELCIHQLLEDRIEDWADAIAVVYEGEYLSYAELNERANQLAHRLNKAGIGPESRVGIMLVRSAEMVVSMLGVLKSGGAYVPLDPSYPRQRLEYMLEDSDVSVVISDRGGIESLSEMSKGKKSSFKLLEISESWEEELSNPVSAVTLGNLAYIIYTSGSTGQPKGVLIEHKGLVNLILAQIRRDSLDRDSRILQYASFSFDASVPEVMRALLSGGCLCLAKAERLLPGQGLIELLREEQITTVTLSPSALSALPSEEVKSLRVIISAGEACSEEQVRRWSRGRRFYNAYGPTETTVCATIEECEETGGRLTIGRSMANTEVMVLGERGERVSIGVKGEIYIGGIGVGRGYKGRGDLTAEKFVPKEGAIAGERVYRTGDVGRYTVEGKLEYLGRRDEQVKIRGYRIETGEVESALKSIEGVKEAAVVVKDDGGIKQLVGYVMIEEGSEKGAREIKAELKKRLPEYMVPGVIKRVKKMPVNGSGKLDRRRLSEEEIEEESGGEKQRPRTELEIEIARIWSEVLGIQNIGIDDNFFDLGGHSLLVTQVISRLTEVFEVDLSVRLLFESPTITELSIAVIQQVFVQDDNASAQWIDQVEGLSDDQVSMLLKNGETQDSL